MKKRIEEIDWRTAKNDAARFIKSNEQESIESWSKELFTQQLEILAQKLLGHI